MTLVIVLLIAAFAIAAGAALIRGLKAFVQDAEIIRQNGHKPPEAFGAKQNRMMTQRVLFQAAAIIMVVLLGSLASQG